MCREKSSPLHCAPGKARPCCKPQCHEQLHRSLQQERVRFGETTPKWQDSCGFCHSTVPICPFEVRWGEQQPVPQGMHVHSCYKLLLLSMWLPDFCAPLWALLNFDQSSQGDPRWHRSFKAAGAARRHVWGCCVPSLLILPALIALCG